MSATARPPRKITLAGCTSLWLTSGPAKRAGTGRGQRYPAGSNEATAWW